MEGDNLRLIHNVLFGLVMCKRIYQKLGVPVMDDLDGPKLMQGYPAICQQFGHLLSV